MQTKTFKNNFLRIFHPGNIKSKFLHLALKGNNVECPCCGSKYITFLPAGLQKRANAKCIKCNSLERHRTLWLYLHEINNFFSEPLKMLHVAPEKQLYLKFSKLPNIDYCPIDLNPENYDYGNHTKKMDVTAMSFPDSYFDVVICNHVLEHIPDDKKAMSEMFRVCKPGGFAILNVPVNTNMETTVEDPSITDPKKMLELFGQKDHVRIYGKDYVQRLIHAGFSVNVIDYVSKFSQNEQFKYGLKRNELIYYCTK